MTCAEREENGEDAATAVEVLPEAHRVMLRRTAWESEAYAFDTVFHSASSQSRVFTEVALPVVEAVMKGYNGTVMAYGQTGTGKTYTLGARGNEDPSERGIMRRAVEMVMDARDSANTAAAVASGGGINVTLQYLQVYQDNVFDLLGEEAGHELNLVEEGGKKGGRDSSEIRVAGAREVHVSSTAEVMKLLDEGDSARAVANHKLNATSSRSHAILILRVSSSSSSSSSSGAAADGGGGGRVTKGKLMLVDLAGSERTSKTGTEGHAQREAQAINKSLTTLGRCIQMLASGGGGHVPYRDSKLTRLLSDSLGGTALTSLIATVGPLREHYSETASTLKFAQQALKVENTLKVKEGVDYKLLCKQLQVKVDEGLAANERMKKLLREANDKTKAAVARMRDMALAEVELSMAKAGAEREADKARAEAEMIKAEAQAAESRAAAEADAGDANAALKAQVDSERLQWHKEKTDMLQLNTTLWNQLDGVLELLQNLKEEYTEEFNYREVLETRDKEVASLREQLASARSPRQDGSTAGDSKQPSRRTSRVLGGQMKLMRQPIVKTWLCFPSVQWVETAVNVDDFPDAVDGDGFESTRLGKNYDIAAGVNTSLRRRSISNSIRSMRSLDRNSMRSLAWNASSGLGGKYESGMLQSPKRSIVVDDDDILADLPVRGTNVLPVLKGGGVAAASSSEKNESPAPTDAGENNPNEQPPAGVNMKSAESNSLPMGSAMGSRNSEVSLISILPEEEEEDVKKRMKMLTMKLAKEKAAEARRKRSSAKASSSNVSSSPSSATPNMSSSVTLKPPSTSSVAANAVVGNDEVQMEFNLFHESARDIKRSFTLDDDDALKAANEIRLFENERERELHDSL